MSLTKLMAEVARECGFAKFDAENRGQGYGYASAAGVINMVNKALTDRNIALESTTNVVHFTPYKKAEKEPSHAVVSCELRFVWRDAEGKVETHVGSDLGEGSDYGDKAIMKASTAAYKYALAHNLVMAWGALDPEDDSKESSKETKKSSRPAARAKPTNGVNTQELLLAVKVAASVEDLTNLRSKIQAVGRTHEDYASIVSAYNERKKELTNG